MATSSKEFPPDLAFHVPYHPSVTEKDMRRAAELLVDYEVRAAETRKQNVKAFVTDLDRRRKKLRSLLGAEHHFALQQLKGELQLEAINEKKPPFGLKTDQAALVRIRTRRITNFLSKRGIKPEVVREIVAHLFDGLSLRSDVEAVGTLQLDDIVLPEDPNPWVVFTPPFTGYSSGYTEVTIGYRVSREYLTDTPAGQVGLIIRLDDGNSGESDSGAVYTDTQVSFWFQAPRAGLIEVVIDAQCGEGRHELRLKNLWGFSSSSTAQRHFLMMHVHHPNVLNPSYSLVSEFKHDDDDNDSFNEQHFFPGQNVHTRLVSNGAVRAGEWVMISAGCRTEDDSEANDMNINSKSTFVWFIKRVNVRMLE